MDFSEKSDGYYHGKNKFHLSDVNISKDHQQGILKNQNLYPKSINIHMEDGLESIVKSKSIL